MVTMILPRDVTNHVEHVARGPRAHATFPVLAIFQCYVIAPLRHSHVHGSLDNVIGPLRRFRRDVTRAPQASHVAWYQLPKWSASGNETRDILVTRGLFVHVNPSGYFLIWCNNSYEISKGTLASRGKRGTGGGRGLEILYTRVYARLCTFRHR